MRFRYSLSDPSQNEFDSLPRLTFPLSSGTREVEATGLVDSGATVNVLPYEIGIRLGEKWDDSRPHIRLAGNLGNFPAIPLAATAKIGDFDLNIVNLISFKSSPLAATAKTGDFDPVRLVFAWVRTDAPLILGQTNFFMEFDVCFYRSMTGFSAERDVNPIRQKCPISQSGKDKI